jgi:hypothetical protein
MSLCMTPTTTSIKSGTPVRHDRYGQGVTVGDSYRAPLYAQRATVTWVQVQWPGHTMTQRHLAADVEVVTR